jgi:cytochrome P450
MFFFLATHKAVAERLTQEIRDAFPFVETIAQGPALNSLDYLHACVDECLRLAPPVPALLPREVLEGGLTAVKSKFPEGTIIGVPTYSLQRKISYFDNPLQFNPNRWLLIGKDKFPENGVTKKVMARQRKAFIPFSVGSRSCIGKNLALVEVELAIARTLWLYDIRFAPEMQLVGADADGNYSIKDHYIAENTGPILQFRKAKK